MPDRSHREQRASQSGPLPPAASAGARILSWRPDLPSAYSHAVERAFTGLSDRLARLHSESAGSQDLFCDLTRADPSRRRLMVRNCHRYHRLAVCELLLEKSLHTVLEDPSHALDMAELAIEVADNLHQETHWGGLPADLQARGWAYLANACRAMGDHRRAEEAFAAAEARLADGTGDPLEAAQLLQLRALLATDRGDFDGAERLLDQEMELYRQSDHAHLVGRGLVHKANVRARRGDLEGAVRLCRQGFDSIDPRRERHLALTARRNLIHYLDACGRHLEAQGILATTRHLDAGTSDGWSELEARWLEGKVAQRGGRLGDAEEAFEAARRGFLARGDVYEAARSTLELAAVYARQGRAVDLSRLAEDMAPLLRSPELRPQAHRALGELQRAAAAHAVTTELVERVASLLEQEQKGPELYHTLTS